MYLVSEEYKEAIRQRVVRDRIAGKITLSDGTKLTISDRSLVKNSLKISHELCDEYRIGTFHIGCLQIAVFDDNALLRDFSGARIEPVYEIETKTGWESVPMGIYYADGNSVRRKRNTVSLTAYDCGCFFDREIPEERRTLWGNARRLTETACADCGVTFGGIPETLPNYDVTVSAQDAQIRTYRDMIAWCAELLCAYAVIDRKGELWFRSAKYGVSQTDNTDILIDKYLTEEERDSIYVTDTRAYIRSISAYSGHILKTYVSDTVQTDQQAAPAGYTFAENPLLPSSLNLEERDKVNTDRLAFIDGFKQRGITAEIYGDPALDAGDVLRCSGGDIDQRRSIVGLVTKQEWRYRNFHTIVCAAPPLLGRDAASAAVVASQTEKKLDALSGKCAYVGGKGIEVSGTTVNLKPAKGGGSDHLENLLGGVWVNSQSGLTVDYDGLLRLVNATVGGKGGIKIGSGLKIDMTGVCSVNLGAGMRYNPRKKEESDVLYGKSISPNLGDGFKIDPSEEEDDPDYGKVHLNLGKGLTFGERVYEKDEHDEDDPTRYTSEVQLKLGKGLSFGADGEINAEGGADLAPGGGITIETDEETGKQTISAAVGEGAEIRDGKICTVPNIQNAVLISEADAKVLLHNFTQVEYLAGNRIGYAGGQNQIVAQGLICYKENGTAPNGETVALKRGVSDLSLIPDVPTYTEMIFDPPVKVGTGSEEFVKIEIRPTVFYADYYMLKIVGVKEGGEESAFGNAVGYYNYDDHSPGLAFAWRAINPPGEGNFGSVIATLYLKQKSSATAYGFTSINSNFTIPFASLAEYQAAVGLTHEPLTLTRVEDDPTAVSGKEAAEWTKA